MQRANHPLPGTQPPRSFMTSQWMALVPYHSHPLRPRHQAQTARQSKRQFGESCLHNSFPICFPKLLPCGKLGGSHRFSRSTWPKKRDVLEAPTNSVGIQLQLAMTPTICIAVRHRNLLRPTGLLLAISPFCPAAQPAPTTIEFWSIRRYC